MPEYDAFGREIGTDPLAETGWQDRPAVEQVATPVPETPRVTAAEVAAAPRAPAVSTPIPQSRQRRSGCAVGVVVLLVLVGGGIAGAIGVFNAGKDAVQRVTSAIPRFPTVAPGGSEGGAPDPPPTPAKGLRSGSLIKQGNFARAMGKLRASGLGRPHSLRVAPDRINAQLVTANGAMRNVQLSPGGALERFGQATPGLGHLKTFAFSRVDRAAPERLTRSAARRLGRGADRVDYLVLFDFGGTILWSVFFKGGAHFQADAAGRITRRVS